MLFKNATVFRLRNGHKIDQESLEELVEQLRFSPIVGQSETSMGLIDPVDCTPEGPLVYKQGNISLLCMQLQEKILPRQVITQELEERVKLRESTGIKVRSAEKKRMMEDIVFEMMPKAFSKFKKVWGYVDHQRNEIIVGTSSNAMAGDFSDLLRQGLGSLPVSLIRCSESPSMTMTRWAETQELPVRLGLGREISLIDNQQDGCSGTFRKQDLTSDEIKECIESGKKVQKLALRWNDHVEFTIDENMVLCKLASMSGMDDKEFDGDTNGDEYPRIAADLFLTATALRLLLPEIYTWFGAEEAPGEIDDQSDAADKRQAEVQGKLAIAALKSEFKIDPFAKTEPGELLGEDDIGSTALVLPDRDTDGDEFEEAFMNAEWVPEHEDQTEELSGFEVDETHEA